MGVDKLQPFQVASYDKPGAVYPAETDTEIFGRLAWLNALLDSFDLHARLNLDEKEKLYRALFTAIPALPTDDYYRVVAIGQFFDPKTPLIFYMRLYEAAQTAPESTRGILALIGNFIITEDKATGRPSRKPMSDMIMPQYFWSSLGICFDDGHVVKGSYLYSEEVKKDLISEAGGNRAMELINLADFYIKDELPDNDSTVPAMLEEVWLSGASTEMRVASRMNLALFHLAHDDLAGAQRMLIDAQNAANGISDPDFRSVLDVQLPHMIELYRRLTD